MPTGDRLPPATPWLQMYSCGSKPFDKGSGKASGTTGHCKSAGVVEGEVAASVLPLWVPCTGSIRTLEAGVRGEDAETVGAVEYIDGALP